MQVQHNLKYLLELQEQKDMYQAYTAQVNERCDSIKAHQNQLE